MRISAKRALTLPVALVSAVALTGLMTGTANAATVSSGSVTLSVNASFLGALAGHGVGFLPSGFSSLSYANGQVAVTYAATGGDADINTYAGTISYSGAVCGFDLKGKSVELSSLLFDFGDAQFDGETPTSGGEVPLVDLAGTQIGDVNGTTETYTASELTLDAAGAAYLNSALDTNAFVSGTDIGSLSATWVI